jgi:hypothetical protein
VQFRQRALTLLAAFGLAVLSPLLALAATTVAPQQIDTRNSGVVMTALSGIPTALTVTDSIQTTCRLTNGTGTGYVNLAPLAVSGSLSTSASVTYDLQSYTDIAGNTVSTMTKLKFLYLENTGTVALDVGAAASNQFIGTGFLKDVSDIITIAASQTLIISVAAGITVSGTVKSLKILNTSGATAGSYKLIIVGSST